MRFIFFLSLLTLIMLPSLTTYAQPLPPPLPLPTLDDEEEQTDMVAPLPLPELPTLPDNTLDSELPLPIDLPEPEPVLQLSDDNNDGDNVTASEHADTEQEKDTDTTPEIHSEGKATLEIDSEITAPAPVPAMPSLPTSRSKAHFEVTSPENKPTTSSTPNLLTGIEDDELPNLIAPELAEEIEKPASSPEPEPVTDNPIEEESTDRVLPAEKAAELSEENSKEASDHLNYQTQTLPPTIYKRSYNKENDHLPRARYESDYTDLLFASAYNNDIHALQGLLALRPNLEIQDNNGNTLLLIAVQRGHVNLARLLLAKGANPNVKNANEDTALHLAVRSQNIPLVGALAEMHAETRIPDRFGRTPMQYARQLGNRKILYLLSANDINHSHNTQ